MKNPNSCIKKMAKRVHWIIVAVLICSFMLRPPSIDALELEFRPRLATGIMQYSIKYNALSTSELSLPGQTSGYNETNGQEEYSDSMTHTGGGVTVFFNRFFVDLSTQYAFDGSDKVQVAYSTYSEDVNDLTTYLGYDFTRTREFDHRDKAIAVGYAVNRNLSVFAGYKWAETGFRSTSDGTMVQFFVSENSLGRTLAHTDAVSSFKYEGPFIGATRGWEVDALRYLKGVLSVKLGLAYLNSDYTTDGTIRLHFLYSDKVDLDIYHRKSKGDTWGFTLGLGWTGNTPIRNLTYSLQVGGYRYNFDNDNVYLGDISETVLNYNAGIAYSF